MGAESITQLLVILLSISIIILLVLIGVFIFVSLKNKQQKEGKKQEEIKSTEVELPSNIVQAKTYTTENIKNFMNFDEIKDNMIIQEKGKRMLMVIQCQGINYDLMSSLEKSGVEQGFSQFLNTLTRPIQIHIQARKVNLEESILRYKKRFEVIESNFNKIEREYRQAEKRTDINPQKMKQIKFEYVRQKNIYEYTKDIILNTEKMSLNQNVLTKNYYIIISYTPDNSDNLFQKEEIMEMAFSELYTNAQAMLRTLSVCGISGKVLNSIELADLLYVAYNRDTSEIYDVRRAIESEYDALYTTAPNVINKRIQELDRIIDEKAFKLAQSTVNKVVAKSKEEKELENKEKNMEELVKEMAKLMIMESEDYFSKDIIEKSINEIDNNNKTKNKKVKKGA